MMSNMPCIQATTNQPRAPYRVAKIFGDYDKDGDGSIDLEELEASGYQKK